MNTLLKLLALFPNNELPEDNHYDFYELASNPCIELIISKDILIPTFMKMII